ncbi:Alpha/Beta hydrolase protein [Linnemannia elongata]|nr:Alpha/Beta hydrolase protein [Linnemannia elongata]
MIPTTDNTETDNIIHPSALYIPGQGSVRGFKDADRSVIRFLNIPYAAVTDRWRQATPVKPWLGVRDATLYGPMCPQTLAHKSTGLTKLFGIPAVKDGFQYAFSERDCLNLAIYVPVLEAPPPVGGIPVIVYIHGGKLRHGGNAHPVYDMSNFVHASVKANQPVITVVINYRLGCLGYFASRELAFEFDSDPDNIRHSRTHDRDPAFGNWGLADQKLAFEWVREHIEAFGGDASNKSFDHLYRHIKVEDAPTVTESQKPPSGDHAQELLQRAQTLRSVSADILMQVPEVKGIDSILYPNLDNKFLFPSPRSLIAKDSPHYDPGVKSVIFGTTKDEGTLFISTHGAINIRQWQPFLDRWVNPELHQEVEAIYGRPQTGADARSFSSKILGDLFSAYPTHSACEGFLAQDDKQRLLYRFHVDRSLEALDNLQLDLGVAHGTDMGFATMSDLSQQYMTEREKAFGYRVMEKYFRFAYGLEDETTPDEPDMVGWKAGSKDGRVATVWSKDFEFRAGAFERMDERTIELWRRNEEWAAQKRPPQSLGSTHARPMFWVSHSNRSSSVQDPTTGK